MRYLRTEEGFTLIETVVASLILVVVLVPMLSTLLGGHQVIYLGRDYITANNLIMQAAEDIRTQTFADLQSGSETVPNYLGSKFSLHQTISIVPNRDSKVKRVDLGLFDGTKEMASLNFILYEKEL